MQCVPLPATRPVILNEINSKFIRASKVDEMAEIELLRKTVERTSDGLRVNRTNDIHHYGSVILASLINTAH